MPNRNPILVVEDDQTIAMGIEYSLKQEGYLVDVRHDAASAREALASSSYQLVLLDISLPDGTGFDLCRLIRSNSDTPVIFLTARDDEVNIVMGLDMGADDYVTKPFRVRELISRIKSVLRRYQQHETARQPLIRIGDILIYPDQARVSKRGQEILLTAMEYKLLLTLATHQGQVLTRSQILESIWDVAGEFVNDNTLTVYIKRLREKLEDDPQAPKYIHTVRGLGYKVGGETCD
jgi:DNA-binding response OmpR family regulator